MTDWAEHEFESVVDKAKAIGTMVNIVEVAELLGMEPDHNGKISSPYKEERTPSCQLYEPDHFFCFASGRGGDAIDLVMAVTGRSWGSAVAVLWNKGLRAGFEPGRHEAVRKPEPIDLYDQFHEAWSLSVARREQAREWEDKLSLPRDLVWRLIDGELLAVGDWSSETLWIPHWQTDANGKPAVRGIKTRTITGAKGSITGSQYGHGLYTSPFEDPQRPAEVAVICEGESDCWTLSWHWKGEPVDVYALPCGAGVWRAEWLEQLAQYQRVYLAFDNDQAGKNATDKVTRSIGWAKAERLQVPDLFNDVRAAYIGGWRPSPPA